VYSTDILEPTAPVISSALVDDVENRLPEDIEYVDDNREVKANVVSQVKLESTR
jgi:hypothetical protein